MSTKYINLNNDFGVDREKEKDVPNDKEITLNWLRTSIPTAFPTLPSDKRRIFANIAQKMDDTLKSGEDYLALNHLEWMFVKEAFEKGVTKPEFAKSITVVENALLSALDELPTPAPAVAAQ